MPVEPAIVVRPASITEWSLPATSFGDLIAAEGRGRFLLANEQAFVRCRRPVLLDETAEHAIFLPRATLNDHHDFPLAGVRLDVVPNARIVGPKFVVVSEDHRVFLESFWANENLNDGVHFVRPAGTRGEVFFRKLAPSRHIAGPALLVGNPWAFNYHHWIINCLARLWWTERFTELRDIPLIVPSDLTPFQQASFTALGIAPEQLLPFDGGVWQVDRLFFPANGDFWPTQLRWIRDRLRQHFRVPSATPVRRLYISRADAATRRIVNERAVIDYLAPKGFEVLHLADIPLGEQVRAFAEARIVIGPHGSAMTNILFGHPQVTLVDLHPADEVNHVFWVEASALGQTYAFLSGPVANANRDFSIDLARLDRLVEKL